MTLKNTTQLETIRLLIVDDHQMVRDGIKVMLSMLKKTFHFDVKEAENVARYTWGRGSYPNPAVPTPH
jgi:DNA-binding NarL/FixJ family response regulator